MIYVGAGCCQKVSFMASNFPGWLEAKRKGFELSKLKLAEQADVSDATIGFLEKGTRKPSRKMIVRLVDGFLGSNADQESKDALINEGRLAAGFTPDSDDPEELDDDLDAIVVPLPSNWSEIANQEVKNFVREQMEEAALTRAKVVIEALNKFGLPKSPEQDSDPFPQTEEEKKLNVRQKADARPPGKRGKRTGETIAELERQAQERGDYAPSGDESITKIG